MLYVAAAPTRDLPEAVRGDRAWPAIDHVCYSHEGEMFVVEPGETGTWWLGHVVPADCEVVELQTRVFCSGQELEHPEELAFLEMASPCRAWHKQLAWKRMQSG